MQKHSEILLEFIAPLCELEETEETVLTKAHIGMLIWNCVVADRFDLKIKTQLQHAVDYGNSRQPAMRRVVEQMTEHKRLYFDEHNFFIVDLQLGEVKDGIVPLKIKTIPADKMEGW